MKNSFIGKLLTQYIENVKGVLAVLVYNRKELFLFDEISTINIDNKLDEEINKIKDKFGEDKDFLIIREVYEKKLTICSLGTQCILLTISEKDTSDIELKVYSLHIASEIEQLIEEPDTEFRTLKIPGIIKVFSTLKKLKESPKKLSLKILVLGDDKSGKTALIRRFTEKQFKKDSISTVGFYVFKKILNIDNKIMMNMAIWDTGGFSSQISPAKEKIFKFADAVIIVVDIANQRSLNSLKKWYNKILDSLSHEAPIFLAITKSDIYVGDSRFYLKDIEDFAENNQIDYFIVSANTGENLDDLFYEIIYKIFNLRIGNECYEFVDEINKYKGYHLEPDEVNALKDLEHIIIESLNNQSKYFQERSKEIEEHGIPIIYEIDSTSFGIKIEEGNVVGLGLFNCCLTTLPDSLNSLKSLQKLNLCCNQLLQLPEVVFELESLEWLDLTLTDLKILHESIGNLKNLRYLYIENNSLAKLPKAIKYLGYLKELNLVYNPIKSLPVEIGNLRALEKLWLEAPSYFYRGGLKKLPNSIGDLIFLKELYLSSCEIEQLPNSFGNLKSLRILDLYNNKLNSLPNTFGNLKMLEILNLGKNKFKFLPDSIGNLSNLKQIILSKNPLLKKASEKFKALALKSKGLKYKRLMKLADICKQEEGTEKIEKIETSKKKAATILKALTYASIVALMGVITFLSFKINSQTLDVTIWTLFVVALFINFIIGACIIASISSYFKISTLVFTHRLIKIFDIFVVIYFIWAIRALIKIFLSIELIPSINFLFEFSVPQWMVDFFTNFGYKANLPFLDNIDLFFGHFYLKIFSIALVFWALYRNGFSHVRKTIFDGKANKKLWLFLILGLFGSLSLAIMNYSNLEPLLDIGYNIGVIIGSSLFFWEINKVKKVYFFYYLFLILGGIVLIWIFSYWSMIYSLIISFILIILYFLLRTWQHKKIKYYLY
jgi:small GTP-binding protein